MSRVSPHQRRPGGPDPGSNLSPLQRQPQLLQPARLLSVTADGKNQLAEGNNTSYFSVKSKYFFFLHCSLPLPLSLSSSLLLRTDIAMATVDPVWSGCRM